MRSSRSSWRWQGLLVCVTLLLLFMSAARAQPLVLQAEQPVIALSTPVFLLRDPGARLPIDAVASPACAGRFQLATGKDLAPGYTRDAIWVCMTLFNASSQVIERYLEMGPPRLEDVRFYERDAAGRWREERAGLLVPVRERSVYSRQSVFAVKLLPGERRTVYLRIASRNAIVVHARLWQPSHFHAGERRVDLINGLQLGAVFIFSLYAFVVFIGSRDKTFLFFGLTLAAYGLYDVGILQYGYEYLWPSSPDWSRRSPGIFMVGMIAGTGYLIAALLQTEAMFPLWDKGLRGLAWGALVLLPGLVWLEYERVVVWLNYSALLMVVLSLSATVHAILQGLRSARVLMLAFLLLWFSSLLRLGQIMGVLPFSLMIDYSQAWSMIVSGMLMAVALGEKVKQLRAERELAREALLAERLDAQERLAQQVSERTQELQLAKESAEKASHAKSMFLAHMSHELRTPLHSVLGYSGLVLDGELSPVSRHRIEAVQRSGRHLLALIDQLLDFVRGAAGRLHLELRPVSLHAFLEEVVADLQMLAHTHGAVIGVELAADVPAVVAVDAVRLRQVLLNLLMNACRHSHGTQIFLEARRGEPTAPAKVPLYLVVRDNGIGIAETDCERIFNPFVQLAYAPGGHGIGLGIPIASQLVKAMGGVLCCSAVTGGGCQFDFTLPVDAAVAPIAEVVPVMAAASRYEGRVRRLLVVDDRADNRELLRAMLLRMGFEVRLADGGPAALAMLTEEAFDLVILDQFMPGQSGWDVFRAAHDRHKALPFVLMSASAPTPPPQWPAQLAFAAILMKPVEPAALQKVLGALLQLSWTSACQLVPRPPAPGATLPRPPAAELVWLRETLEMGLVTDIEDWVEQAIAAGAIHAGFARAVLEALRRLDMPALRHLIEH